MRVWREPRNPANAVYETAVTIDNTSVGSEYIGSRAKRTFDILGSLALMPPSLLAVVFARTAVGLSDGMPTQVKLPRVGKSGEMFWQHKIRTMRVYEEDVFPLSCFKSPDDKRIIPGVGRFLRTSSIDELPQLIDVIRGDMSLVGPRPMPEYEILGVREVIGLENPALYKRWRETCLRTRPGITGLSQINVRSHSSKEAWKRRMELDNEYDETASLEVDFGIIVRTLGAVARRRGAM